ncbi:crossover junction endonuclease EME1 isoform X2 [Bombus bifarius]|uniref:Crossover junction endonuclease EME1 isoform X2 n=1 Tax=Bombus bifarius TaxID=103933 RepID=A0A6P8N3K9_9HYME|nr:crossover junction endonuclease EME1 isoform X2 [Bombus vancouverensis nearcticus]XP_033309522.1 crossover junction endonuclease EME1 isoform X2 [Bombus bifarius]
MITDVVVLSDSNESSLSVQSNSNNRSLSHNYNSSDLEFPAINFHHIINEDDVSKSRNIDIASCSSNFNTNGSSYQTDDKHTANSKNFKQYNVRKFSYNVSNSSDSDEKSSNTERQRKGKGTVRKKSRIELNEEKLKKQECLMREKALKAIAVKKSKDIKPGEYIIDTLRNAGVTYTVKTEFISNSITWKRSIENSYIDDTNKICTVTDIEQISQILIIWNWDEAVIKVTDGSFCTSISSIKSSLPDYKITLVIFGIEDYFACREQRRNLKESRTKKKTYIEKYHQMSTYPHKISRKHLETCLNEIQIISDCSSRLINNSQDLALMIYQYTKAIAEIPYKSEKNKNLTNKFDWYVMGDNRNTVKVDKSGNGLKRLWQQQLCQFNLSSLEIAEAICSVYPSPANLIEAYMNCTDTEGVNLLKDIPIRRAAGPLTTVRKVGPELSKKVYLMFSSKNGENVLS